MKASERVLLTLFEQSFFVRAAHKPPLETDRPAWYALQSYGPHFHDVRLASGMRGDAFMRAVRRLRRAGLISTFAKNRKILHLELTEKGQLKAETLL